MIYRRTSFAYFICSLLSVVLLYSCGGVKEIVKAKPKKTEKFAFDFVHSEELASVLALAAAENKLIMMDVYTTWCLPCQMMDKDVFSHQNTADIINKDFISYKVDAEKTNGPILVFNYDVTQYPTLIFMDATGKVLERNSGATYHRQLKEMAASAKSKSLLIPISGN